MADLSCALLSSATISQHISHVIMFLTINRVLRDSSTVRLPALRFQLDGYAREDRIGRPQRLCVKIPVTYEIVVEFVHEIANFVPAASALWWALRAAIGLGFGLSLRPNEYLLVSHPVDDDHYVQPSNGLDAPTLSVYPIHTCITLAAPQSS
jgi:hypothetical protein